MSKKPKRSRHRVPALSVMSDPVDAEYQAEVDLSMAHLEKRYAKAQKALAAAELKAQRAQEHAANLRRKQEESAAIAANREAEEQRLGEYIEQIKKAAKDARIRKSREELAAKQREAVRRRDALAAQRKAEARQRLERERHIATTRTRFKALEAEVAERSREVREIERLMMPGNYAGRSHRRGPRHQAGGAA